MVLIAFLIGAMIFGGLSLVICWQVMAYEEQGREIKNIHDDTERTAQAIREVGRLTRQAMLDEAERRRQGR